MFYMHNPSDSERHVESPLVRSNFSPREKLAGVMALITIGALACSAIVLEGEDRQAEIKASLEQNAQDAIYRYVGVGTLGIENVDADNDQHNEHKLAEILLYDGTCFVDYITQELPESSQGDTEIVIIDDYGDCPTR